MIEWTDEMSVGIGEFDTHHRRIIDLINKLDGSLGTDEEKKIAGDALAELSNYCIYHFFAEEDAMEKFRFAGYAEHKDEHLKFVGKIFGLIDDMHSGREDLNRELLDFLWFWLKNHILVTDKKYTAVLLEGGIY